MTAIKRTLAALVLSGGAALALTPVAAHADANADGRAIEGPPITQRLGEIANHPGQAVQDTKTAVGATTGAVGSASKATGSSLSGTKTALHGLPKTPKVGG
ncbi:hypothetical protein ACGFYU_31905 [Streptomyces sp. NPDC048337]|uniref:hypothetical protein n=1 Tax=Streptomyces sp. NPDC048337 TaxID=3365535 RepID=UPI003715EB84